MNRNEARTVADQIVRRGGDPARSLEAAAGTLAPSSSLPAAPTTAAAATAPAPARRPDSVDPEPFSVTKGEDSLV